MSMGKWFGSAKEGCGACHREHLHGRTNPREPPCLCSGSGVCEQDLFSTMKTDVEEAQSWAGLPGAPHKPGGPMATWLPCQSVAGSVHQPRHQPRAVGSSAKAQASLHLGLAPSNTGSRSLLQNWTCPKSQPPVAPGEASAVQWGAVRWGQSTAAGLGPRVSLPGAWLPPLCPESLAALCPCSGFTWCTCGDCPVLGSEVTAEPCCEPGAGAWWCEGGEGLPLLSHGVGTGFLTSPQETPAEVEKYHPLFPLGFQWVTSAFQCHRTHAGHGCYSFTSAIRLFINDYLSCPVKTIF